jgi:hypothetical protein
LKNDANAKTRDLGKGHLATKKVIEEIESNYNVINENQANKEQLDD